MRYALALAIPLFTLLACSMPGHPAKADPPATDQQIAARVTHAIWPAISAYNGAPTQTSAGSTALQAVMDPALTGDAFNALRSAAAKLGRQGEYDPATHLSYFNDGMAAARTDITSVHDNTATVNVCYTYTEWSYVNLDDRQQSPGSAQATLDLVRVDDAWYLHTITNDHAVGGCGPQS